MNSITYKYVIHVGYKSINSEPYDINRSINIFKKN